MPPDTAERAYPVSPAVEPVTPVAELRGVSKYFGDVRAAEDLNLAIRPGEFLSFLGPSGCGKTTALRMLAGFEQPTTGNVVIDGQVVNTLAPYLRPVNMVFQSYALFPHMNVVQNVGYGLRQRSPRLPRREIDDKVARALETVRLSGFENRRVWEMSGGQQQRVALARAIVNGPKLLLLDEPLAALDRKLRKEMQIELQDLQRKIGITFVLVTHDQEEALSLSDRVCVMRAGRIVQIDTPEGLYDRPASRYVADFVGTSNFFDGRVTEVLNGMARIEVKTGKTYLARAGEGVKAGANGTLSVRPELIALSAEAREGSLEVQVLNRIFLGEHSEYLVGHADLGHIIVFAPRRSEGGSASFSTGARAYVSWARDAALVLRPD
jgi:spermidine/putrescine transport system ATP-binding protein